MGKDLPNVRTFDGREDPRKLAQPNMNIGNSDLSIKLPVQPSDSASQNFWSPRDKSFKSKPPTKIIKGGPTNMRDRTSFRRDRDRSNRSSSIGESAMLANAKMSQASQMTVCQNFVSSKSTDLKAY